MDPSQNLSQLLPFHTTLITLNIITLRQIDGQLMPGCVIIYSRRLLMDEKGSEDTTQEEVEAHDQVENTLQMFSPYNFPNKSIV